MRQVPGREPQIEPTPTALNASLPLVAIHWVEILLRQVTGEGRDNRGQERDHAGNPGHRPAAPPRRHPELALPVNEDIDPGGHVRGLAVR